MNDIKDLNFNNLVCSDVNQSMNNILKALSKITDKHSPLKINSNSQKRLLKKAIHIKTFISLKERDKFFQSHFLSKDPDEIKQHKIYRNKFNELKGQGKKYCLTAQFDLNKYNIKAT